MSFCQLREQHVRLIESLKLKDKTRFSLGGRQRAPSSDKLVSILEVLNDETFDRDRKEACIPRFSSRHAQKSHEGSMVPFVSLRRRSGGKKGKEVS
ncbi:hypothetical protein E2C01_080173 [Portunus trituberculatus]|uniref:Uncharacterized protein n=1 Tax=Portunus trituberculatus TaxID=210409 RepID=A0A5B7IIW1_PORTR|nr:hypothetical protein [Portunus trituberculatus]